MGSRFYSLVLFYLSSKGKDLKCAKLPRASEALSEFLKKWEIFFKKDIGSVNNFV